MKRQEKQDIINPTDMTDRILNGNSWWISHSGQINNEQESLTAENLPFDYICRQSTNYEDFVREHLQNRDSCMLPEQQKRRATDSSSTEQCKWKNKMKQKKTREEVKIQKQITMSYGADILRFGIAGSTDSFGIDISKLQKEEKLGKKVMPKSTPAQLALEWHDDEASDDEPQYLVDADLPRVSSFNEDINVDKDEEVIPHKQDLGLYNKPLSKKKQKELRAINLFRFNELIRVAWPRRNLLKGDWFTEDLPPNTVWYDDDAELDDELKKGDFEPIT